MSIQLCNVFHFFTLVFTLQSSTQCSIQYSTILPRKKPRLFNILQFCCNTDWNNHFRRLSKTHSQMKWHIKHPVNTTTSPKSQRQVNTAIKFHPTTKTTIYIKQPSMLFNFEKKYHLTVKFPIFCVIMTS